jgi:hypothetical protein
MNPLRCSSLAVLLVGSVSLPAWAAPAADPAAAQHCEKAVARAIEEARGREVHDLGFDPARRSVDINSDNETDVRGQGRYRRGNASVSFSYTCAYDPQTKRTSGVLFKDEPPAAPTADRPWQPDLTHLSPDACETAIAAVLKDKHPRVDHIVFNAATRKLQPLRGDNVQLVGQGTLQRAPGMVAMPFQYHCEYDSRSGKLLGAQAED